MTRVAIAQGHQMPIPSRHLRVNPDLSDTKSSARQATNKLIAPLRKLKRALARSAFSGGSSTLFGIADSTNLTTAAERTSDSKDKTPLIAFIGANGASGTALEFITHEAVGRDTNFMEFQAIEDLFEFVERGNACDLALLDWDSLGHEALQYVRRRPAITAQIAFVVMTNSAPVVHGGAETPANAEGLERNASECTRQGDEKPERRPLQVLRYGALSLDFRTDRAFWKDRPVDLTVTQFNIVHLFAQHIGENLTYRQIYDVVHKPGFHAGDGEDGYQTNVRSLIKRIRQQFRATDSGFAEIENHRGVGYRWRCADEADDVYIRPEVEVPMDSDESLNGRSPWSKLVGAMSKPRTAPSTAPDTVMLAADPLK